MKFLQKILIANRGEIAERIIRTCREMNIETIAVYSDADKDSRYVQLASKAYRIGEPPVMKSYLNSESILEVAVQEKVDGIHPGYGFLSENAEFVKKVEEAGITFIGPNADVIALMGDKVASRSTMQDAGVPVVPGSDGGVKSVEEACKIASEIGYPVMLKASGGGGGIGMQKCDDEDSLRKIYDSTKTRAKSYFGTDEVFIEKFIGSARHVEVQVFGDSKGNIIHLFERDCSVQRRNQKVIEEAPSPFLSQEARTAICEAAVKAARHVSYTNAGTVEFIVDSEQNFYFLEMNTRLQVEHPVTESITGLDLVKWQILVSRGEALPLLQDEISCSGHSMEFRLYAEDPVKFLPSPGKISAFSYPSMDGVRLDFGYGEDSVVTPFYDPMIGKIIISANSRDEVLERAAAFFKETKVEGIKTNLPLFQSIIEDEDFKNNSYDTSFLSKQLVRP